MLQKVLSGMVQQTQQYALQCVAPHRHSPVLKKGHIIILQHDDAVREKECSYSGDLE